MSSKSNSCSCESVFYFGDQSESEKRDQSESESDMQKGEVRMAESGKGGTEEASEPEQDQDGLSAHSPFQAPRSSASSLPKELPQVELELRLLQALEIYHPAKLQGMHRHFVLFGLMEYLKKRLNRNFSADEILQLLDRFYNIEMLKPDDEEMEILNQEEEFSLPPDFHDEK